MEGSGESVSITEHRKLSLESLGSSGNKGDKDKEINNVSNHDYSQKHNEFRPLKEANIDLSKNLGKQQSTRNKLSLKLPVSSHSRNDETDKENLAPNPQQTHQPAISTTSSVSEYSICCNQTGPETAIKLTNHVISDKKQQTNEVCLEVEGSHLPEAVIVLDSEDESEDEVVPVRSKLSLARRCLSRKRKMASNR